LFEIHVIVACEQRMDQFSRTSAQRTVGAVGTCFGAARDRPGILAFRAGLLDVRSRTLTG
jgi:hypothetical protein